jgi:hypothetical protein
MANPNTSVKARKHGVPNKMSSARVERALREGKRLPPENLLSRWVRIRHGEPLYFAIELILFGTPCLRVPAALIGRPRPRHRDRGARRGTRNASKIGPPL